MKGQIFVWVLMVFILVLLGLGYAQMIQMDQVTSQKIRSVEYKVGGFDATIKGLEADVKAGTTAVKGFESRISSGETQARDMSGKVESLMKEVAAVKAELADVARPQSIGPAPAPASAPVVEAAIETVSTSVSDATGSVELGTIPVQK